MTAQIAGVEPQQVKGQSTAVVCHRGIYDQDLAIFGVVGSRLRMKKSRIVPLAPFLIEAAVAIPSSLGFWGRQQIHL